MPGLRGAGILAGAAMLVCGFAAGAFAQDLRDRLETLAGEEGFALTGAERLSGDAPGPVAGDVETRLRKLLQGYDFVLVHDGNGRVARLSIVGAQHAPEDRAGSNAVETVRRGSEHYVKATLSSGNGRAASALFLLDTGASTVVAPLSMAKELGIAEDLSEDVVLQTANGRISGRSAVLKSVSVGDKAASDVTVTFVPDQLLGGKRLLGMSFLGRFVVTIDDKTGRMTLATRGP